MYCQEEEEVLDLPEDPDFSVLKLPIAGGITATGVAGPAMLLSTATEEVSLLSYLGLHCALVDYVDLLVYRAGEPSLNGW